MTPGHDSGGGSGSAPGEGVFETIRVRQGRLPLLDAHLARLAAAVRVAGLPMPPRLAERLQAFAPEGEGVVRVTVTAAGAVVVSRPVPPLGDWRLITAARIHEPYPIKRTGRAAFEEALAAARAAAADEAVLLTADGWLAEGAISAVGFWTVEALCLPALDLGVLPGVGRARMVHVARKAGITVSEGRWRRDAWLGRPMLAVNAVRGVTAVRAVDGKPVPSDSRTGRLAAGFWPDPDSEGWRPGQRQYRTGPRG